MLSNVLKSHKPAAVYTFVPSRQPAIIKQLNSIIFDSKDKLHKNYTDIDWNHFSAVSVYFRNNAIVGFSSVWHRPDFYEPKEARILSRYYEFSKMRRTSKIIADSHLIEMITQQIAISQQLGFAKVFISREKTPKYFAKLIQEIRVKTQRQWILEPQKVCVCKPSNFSCWQYKAWTDLRI
jgi:hypothetical protein